MSGPGDADLDHWLAAARDAADAATRLLAQVRPADVRDKGNPRDLVTEWDVRAEEVIRARLAVRTPDIAILGEEGGEQAGAAASGVRWLVDPIDGTVNFAHGLPLWAVSIGLEVDGEAVVGVVSAPAVRWTFWARKGGGAWADVGAGTERLAVSRVGRLEQALLVSGFPYDRATSPQNNFAQWEHFQRVAGACRRLGAASLDLCLVARGWFDGYWEFRLKPWDLAAGALIVEEAGGRISAPYGDAWSVDAGEIVASNGRIHDQIVDELRGLR